MLHRKYYIVIDLPFVVVLFVITIHTHNGKGVYVHTICDSAHLSRKGVVLPDYNLRSYIETSTYPRQNYYGKYT